MNLGLRDAMALTQAVVDHSHQHGPGHAMVLAEYADNRRLDVTMTAGFTEGVLTAFGVTGWLPEMVRQTGLRMMGKSGGLRRLLIDYATGQAQTLT